MGTNAQSGIIRRLFLHPKGFWFVIWGELAERASFYGMRTLLALYTVNVLGFSQNQGAAIIQFFMAACFITPLLGGYIADRYLGRYKTILYFSAPYIVGQLILGAVESRSALLVALVLLALGSGSIKPNTSTLMGHIYDAEGKQDLRSEAFSYYYAAINVGAALSSLMLPLLRDRWGYSVALSVPAVLMVIAFFLFAMGRKYYPEEKTSSQKTRPQNSATWASLREMVGIFLLIALFFAVYDQEASTWTYFAAQHCNLELFNGISVSPDQIQGINPILIVLFTPLLTPVWRWLSQKRGGRTVEDTTKMAIGFGAALLSMVFLTIAGQLSLYGKVSVWWLLLATFVMVFAELCITVVGLEFAYKRAAPGTESFVTGVFWLTSTLGDVIGGFLVTQYEHTLNAGAYFASQVVLIALAFALFLPMSRRIASVTETG